MFCVFVRCTSTPGTSGCWASVKDKNVAEKQAGFITSDIAAGKGFYLTAQPYDGRRVAIGAEFASRNTWEVTIIETQD